MAQHLRLSISAIWQWDSTQTNKQLLWIAWVHHRTVSLKMRNKGTTFSAQAKTRCFKQCSTILTRRLKRSTRMTVCLVRTCSVAWWRIVSRLVCRSDWLRRCKSTRVCSPSGSNRSKRWTSIETERILIRHLPVSISTSSSARAVSAHWLKGRRPLSMMSSVRKSQVASGRTSHPRGTRRSQLIFKIEWTVSTRTVAGQTLPMWPRTRRTLIRCFGVLHQLVVARGVARPPRRISPRSPLFEGKARFLEATTRQLYQRTKPSLRRCT